MEFNIKSKNSILIIILAVLIIIFLLIFDYRNNDVLIEEESKVNDYKLLNDYSRFFTVNSCVIRYINYIENDDKDSLLKVLSNEYIKYNGINSDNIYNYIEKLDGNYSFISKKIYFEKINNNNIKYYVYGELLEDTINGEVIKDYKYYLVTLDNEEQLFNISPYDGRIFKEDI